MASAAMARAYGVASIGRNVLWTMSLQDRRMTSHPHDRSLTRLGPFAGTVVTVGLMAGAAVSGAIRGGDAWLALFLVFAIYAGSASLIGAIILRSRPGHGVGRICLAGGAILAVGYAALEMAEVLNGPLLALGIESRQPLLAVGTSLLLIGAVAPFLGVVILGPVLLAAFPSGRFGPAARRGALVLLAVFVPLVVLTAATTPTFDSSGLSVANPLYLRGSSLRLAFDLTQVAIILYAASLALALIGIAFRYRRADPVGRLQIRWVGGNLLVSVVLFALAYLASGNWALFMLAVLVSLLTPASIAVAILRYRLYDLDRIVSNTVGYGLVTVVPFVVFAAVTLSLVFQMSPLVNNEEIAVAAFTILVAALFNPVRIRVQRGIDRRFHRAHYDAERMVSDFAARLRDELDLPTIAAELASTTARAVEPTTADLWLRARAR
jgi:hypothetical protein